MKAKICPHCNNYITKELPGIIISKPKSCKCDPGKWGYEDIPKICKEFVNFINKFNNTYENECINCGHDKKCHEVKK